MSMRTHIAFALLLVLSKPLWAVELPPPPEGGVSLEDSDPGGDQPGDSASAQDGATVPPPDAPDEPLQVPSPSDNAELSPDDQG